MTISWKFYTNIKMNVVWLGILKLIFVPFIFAGKFVFIFTTLFKYITYMMINILC